MTADQFFDWVEATIRTRFAAGVYDEEGSKLILMLEGRATFLPCPNREFARMVVSEALPLCQAIGFVSEAWTTSMTEEEFKARDLSVPIKDMAGRQETLVLVYYTKAMQPKSLTIPIITHEDGTRELGPRDPPPTRAEGALFDGLGNMTQFN